MMNDDRSFITHHSSFMWNDRLRFAERVADDWRALSATERDAVLAALEVIDEDPIIGAPLFEPLRGYWSHRVGHVRIVYRVMAEARIVVVLSIGRAAP